MDWSQPLNHYCERLDASFWAEPLNALSNLGFIVAAGAALLYGRRAGGLTPGNLVLIILLAVIGTGSFLFHTQANLWSLYADSVPIFLFQVCYLGLYGAHFARQQRGRPWRGAVLFLVLFLALTKLFGQLPADWLNGSVMYLPAWLMLLLVAIHHLKTSAWQPRLLLVAVALFTLSLTLRSVDMLACPQFAFGTHFVWHLLNSVMLYLLIIAAIQSSQGRALKSGRTSP